jgi:hypothetical protein
MANPFSGLENIGQSYLQGVQLANQRQAREEAIAQRQEEARVRGQYYQDLVDQRREAAALAAKSRDEGLAAKFGKFLKRNPDGSIDIVGSATAQTEGGDKDQLLETVGFAETMGSPITEVTLSEEDRKSKSYLRGKTKGIVQKTSDDRQLTRILASQGFFPGGEMPQIPADLEPTITGQGPETIFDILSGAGPAAPAAAATLPEGMIPMTVAGRQGLMRKPKAAAPAKVDRPITVTIRDEDGKPLEAIKMSKEEFADYKAKSLSAPPAAAGTNAAPVGRIFYDPNAPFGAGYAPLK